MTDTPPTEPQATVNDRAWMRQAVDFGALAAFGAAYLVLRLRGLEGGEALVQATWVLIAGSAIALIVGYALERRLAPLPLLTGGFALVFGIITIVFDDPSVLQIKFSVQNALLGAVLLGSLPLKRYPFKYLLGDTIKVTDAGWQGLTLRYGLYFTAVAITNEVIRHTQTYDTWMGFRGVIWVAAMGFGLLQIPFILKHMIRDEPPGPVSPDTGL